jgi:hypothetical protein
MAPDFRENFARYQFPFLGLTNQLSEILRSILGHWLCSLLLEDLKELHWEMVSN